MDQNMKLSDVIKSVSSEKGVNHDVLFETLETALCTAAKRIFGSEREFYAEYNPDMDEIDLFQRFEVVNQEDLVNINHQITSQDVEDYADVLGLEDPLPGVGEIVDIPIYYREDDREIAVEQDELLYSLTNLKTADKNFGRIAAQTAKQVILSHMREAEQSVVYERYKDIEDSLVSGKVRRYDKGNLIIALDGDLVDAILPAREQMQREVYRPGDAIEAYVKKVNRSSREPQIVLSRTAPEFVIKLFEKNVTEIKDGIVKIIRVARQPGMRTKIAVYSTQSEVDAVGACVGLRGARVQNVVNELHGEKIDIVPFHDDAARFVCSAISPAEVIKVFIDEDVNNPSMEIIVPNDQLSLAIGRGGQNVRLAAQLTGWDLDIISESRLNELKNQFKSQLLQNPAIDEERIDTLFTLGYNKLEHIASVDPYELAQIPGFGLDNAELIINEAKRLDKIAKRAENDREHRDANISDMAVYLGITEKQAKLLYNGGYHNLPMCFVEGKAERMDAKTGLGCNLTKDIIQNLTDLALGQEVYAEEELADVRSLFDACFAENDGITVEDAYAKTVEDFGEEKVFPVDEDELDAEYDEDDDAQDEVIDDDNE